MMKKRVSAILLLLCGLLDLTACDAKEAEPTPEAKVFEYSFEDFFGEKGEMSFPLFAAGMTQENVEEELGMSLEEFKSAQKTVVDASTGSYSGNSLLTVEGVPVTGGPAFDKESGLVSSVVLQFCDDGRSREEWEKLTESWVRASGSLTPGGSGKISADGKTEVIINYTSTGEAGASGETPLRLESIIMKYVY